MIDETPASSDGGGSHLTERLAATLLGVALGDALGLPCEGMSARSIARRFGPIDRFRLLGKTGFISDDTEQAALIAQSLARHPDDPDACACAFARALLGWFCRLPWGVGLATVRACVRIALGLTRSGVLSAGNGASMRAAIVGVFFYDRPLERRAFGRALAQVTHRDERAVEGAIYVAELAACLACLSDDRSWEHCVAEARTVVTHSELGAALDQAIQLATDGASVAEGARICGNSGFVVHTIPFATFCLLRHGGDSMRALSEAIGAGGDTDSIAAILGGWLGALHGHRGLPAELIARIHDGPFGPTHLRALGSCLSQIHNGVRCAIPRYSATFALVRNLALWPVILAHGLRRLVPI